MKKLLISACCIVLLAISTSCQNDQNTVITNDDTQLNPNANLNPIDEPQSAIDKDPADYEGLSVEESASYGGLQVFLLKGKGEIDSKEYVTLDKAMRNNMVTVSETGNVGELNIKNTSDKTVYLHSGDIVKGGKQDRTVANDMIIPPHSEKIPLKSFCVEASRWTNRGSEDVSTFSENTRMLSSKELKYAAKYKGDQSEVWRNVATEQTKLSSKVSELSGENVDVKQNASGSSLQLTLENKELKKVKKEMEKKFKNLMKQNVNVVGFAYAINGKVYGAEVFNNKQLMNDLWGKMSESIMNEAVANADSTYQDSLNVSASDVVKFMNETSRQEAKESTKQVNESTDLIIKETDGDVLFSTEDKEENKWLHKSYMEKEKGETTTRKTSSSNNSYDITNGSNVNQRQVIAEDFFIEEFVDTVR